MKKLFFIVLMAMSCTGFAKDEPFYEDTLVRNYTTTIMRYPNLCMSDEFSKSCTYFTNYYVGRFEHDYIGYITDHLDFDMYENDVFNQRESAVQKVNLDYRVIRKYGFVSVIARVVQNFKNKEARFTEVFNISLDSQKQILFSDLFKDPELAAMICSNAVYDHFAKYRYPALHLVKAQVEVQPKNFMILPDGLEFEYSRGVLAPPDVKARVVIPLSDLTEALPVKKWFHSLDDKASLPKGISSVDPLEDADETGQK